jgi:hypothetical protein
MIASIKGWQQKPISVNRQRSKLSVNRIAEIFL